VTTALAFAALALVGLMVVFLTVLVSRRAQLARRARSQARLEEEVRPLALALVDGRTGDAEWELSRPGGEAIAAVLARYSRLLTGDSRARIASFFEVRGLVARTSRDAVGARSAWRRARAARLLGEMASRHAIPALIECLEDRDRSVRAATARSLAQLRAVEAAAPLVQALVDHRLPHLVAANALLDIGSSILPGIEPLLESSDADARTAALELIAHLGDASHGPAVTGCLDDPSAEVRARACRALGRVGAGPAAETLREALADPEPSVRAAAAVALGDLGDRGAVEALVVQAQGDEFAPARAAARAVGRMAPQRVSELGRLGPAAPHLAETADRIALGML
jgi:HEAT repeat protein